MNLSLNISRRDPCRIIINSGLMRQVGKILKKEFGPRKIFVVTDRTVKRLHYSSLQKSLIKSGLQHEVISFPSGEVSKNLKTYEQIISRMSTLKADRKSIIVAFGGGVTGDMAGLAAATYMRGIELVQIPTTLVAQIDSSIGGKVAVDHRLAKNLIGGFYNSALTLIDPDLLSTLKKVDFNNGLFEAVKIALVSNGSFYEYIKRNYSKIEDRDKMTMEHLIRKAVCEKVNIVREDPFDNGRRAILNFGHTFGHALETIADYKNISHGTAVGWGMILALQLSVSLEDFPLKDRNEIEQVIRQLLASESLPRYNINRLWQTILHDKKVEHDSVRFVLLKKIGHPVIRDIDKQSFKIALEKIL